MRSAEQREQMASMEEIADEFAFASNDVPGARFLIVLIPVLGCGLKSGPTAI